MPKDQDKIYDNLERLTYPEFVAAIALSRVMSDKDFYAIMKKPDPADRPKDMAWRRLCEQYNLITRNLPKTGKQRDRENYLKARLDEARADVKNIKAELKVVELKLSSHMVRAKPGGVKRRKLI